MWYNQLPLSPCHLPGLVITQSPKQGAHAAQKMFPSRTRKRCARIGRLDHRNDERYHPRSTGAPERRKKRVRSPRPRARGIVFGRGKGGPGRRRGEGYRARWALRRRVRGQTWCERGKRAFTTDRERRKNAFNPSRERRKSAFTVQTNAEKTRSTNTVKRGLKCKPVPTRSGKARFSKGDISAKRAPHGQGRCVHILEKS